MKKSENSGGGEREREKPRAAGNGWKMLVRIPCFDVAGKEASSWHGLASVMEIRCISGSDNSYTGWHY